MERIIRIKRRMGNKREGERENKRTGEGLNRKLFICATREKKTMRRLFGKWRRTGRLKKASLGYANGRNGAPFLQVSPPWLSRQLSTFSSSLFYFSLSILHFFSSSSSLSISFSSSCVPRFLRHSVSMEFSSVFYTIPSIFSFSSFFYSSSSSLLSVYW